ncbi:MAG: 1-acyl-sn-glycerol-3-phosphate acyltransferase [Planctomycetes bacterium]|nr:1-acyl-sn-glycerol-3-phosphate acyltransferase [Planctomycetota bacterium]
MSPPMAALRTTLRVGRLALATLLWFAAFVTCAAVWPSKKRRDRLRDRVLHRWSRSVLRILCVRVQVDGEIGGGGGLLVANHLSYLDVPVFASLLPVSILSKSDVASWPVLGWLARAIGIQFVVREDKRALPLVAARLHDEVRRGHDVLFFPEGTSSSGASVLPFRPALLAPAAEARLPVRHAAIRYATPPGCPAASLAVCWWGTMTFLPHALGVLRLPWIEAHVRFGREPVRDDDRKRLAKALQTGVERDLAAMAVVGPTAP